MTFETTQQPLTIPVDREHGRLRLAILLSFIVIWVFGYAIINALLPNMGLNLLAIILGFGAAYLGTAVLERYLKQHWPSGRAVQLDAKGVRLMQGGAVQENMATDADVSLILWRFEVKKRARVPKGHWMLAGALRSDERYLPVYTFMPPGDLEAYEYRESFKVLAGKRERETHPQNNLRQDLRLAGEQRRLMEAENVRWVSGVEMTTDEFKLYIDGLLTRYPEWRPLN
ncbi:MAG: hypothetical protein GYB67_02310 [Chloroflexi bacterium]|nr:hypothetical protein [Chloroflexota bacterium]